MVIIPLFNFRLVYRRKLNNTMTLDCSADADMPAHQDSKMLFMKKCFKILAPYYRKQFIQDFRGTVLLKLVLLDSTTITQSWISLAVIIVYCSILCWRNPGSHSLNKKHLHRLDSWVFLCILEKCKQNCLEIKEPWQKFCYVNGWEKKGVNERTFLH